uniref:Uncharacterized protein n=1 Tax=Anopheles quadriannulatus TaxID=34691 RepID=A0A182XTP1_ANOQN
VLSRDAGCCKLPILVPLLTNPFSIARLRGVVFRRTLATDTGFDRGKNAGCRDCHASRHDCHSDHFATYSVSDIGLSYGAGACPVIHGTSLRIYSTSTVLVPAIHCPGMTLRLYLSSMALFPVIHYLGTTLHLHLTSMVLFPEIHSYALRSPRSVSYREGS